ncbi:MAG: thymidine kinase [Paracoccaceae bacterium]|nr:MAG: thymidine kinase [Paracoccaceae bacterium]
MAKLFFNYSTMNAGKSTILLQAAHNYEERGMIPYLLTAEIDKRFGEGKIASRIGIEKQADTFNDRLNLYNLLKSKQKSSPISCVLIDEAQFLTKEQVWQLASAVDDLFLPILCYGLRVDFQGNLFPGSSALLGLADELKEIKTICHCGKKATMVVRKSASNKPIKDGSQIQIGGNDLYESLCRVHWRQLMES